MALRELISADEELLKGRKAKLSRIVTNCNHRWSEPVADHIYHKGYRIDGDPVGTMGVDWRGPVDVSPRTEKRWKRVCSECGKVEHTSNTNKRVTESPRF